MANVCAVNWDCRFGSNIWFNPFSPGDIYWALIGLGNGLVPVWHQAIAWINDDLLSTQMTKLRGMKSKQNTCNVYFNKIHFEMLSAKCPPFSSGLSILCHRTGTMPVNQNQPKRCDLQIHYKVNIFAQLSRFPDHADVIMVMIDVNTLRPRQNGRYFPDDIFKCIFLNENV